MRAFGSRSMVRVAAALAVAGCSGVACGSAGATAAAPGWEITEHTLPTNFAPGSKNDKIELDVLNTGAQDSSGPVTVTDTLPPGVTATSAGFRANVSAGYKIESVWTCEGEGTSVVTCTSAPAAMPTIATGVSQPLVITVNVGAVQPGVETNHASIVGGGALVPAATSEPLVLSSERAGFGFSSFDAWFTNADGTADTQAGSHPYELTVSFDMNNVKEQPVEKGWYDQPAGGHIRNLAVNLPPGIIGNPTAVPRCTREQFDGEHSTEQGCPAASQVGVDNVGIAGIDPEEDGQLSIPVYNLVPPAGVPAQFAFYILGIETFIDASVRSGGDYGITENTDNIIQRQSIVHNAITIWGTPGEASHDAQRRGSGSCEGSLNTAESSGCASGAPLAPLLTLPTGCAGPLTFTAQASPWEFPEAMAQASSLTHDNGDTPVGFTGCDHLEFGPSLSAAPDTSAADTPAGLTVDVKAAQEGLTSARPEHPVNHETGEEALSLSASDIADTTVTLPEGVVINPGQAAGLQACGPSEDGLTTASERAAGREDDGPPSCPAASKVGTVQIETPLLAHELEGNVYVMQSDPPHLQLLVAASGEGVNLKLVGDVHLNEQTGQLTTTFQNTPELPFTDLKLSFSGGAQAALTTPTGCGTYTTTSDFTSWSSPFLQDAFPSSSFTVATGPLGGACRSPLPFNPTLNAGSTTDQAGGFTDFSLLLTREDDQQRIGRLQFKTPEGLLGMISKVPLCGEPQAAEGTCPAASQIGHTVVEAGPGPYPLVVPQPGQPPAPIYLTGGYDGAPYGLSIVVPLHVGPFTLQTQVVRARIEVDPLTTQLTVTTDPLPSIIDGIPADLRAIDAVIDRPGFMFNPTGCEPQAFSGTATSAEGTAAPISSHFQMGSCRALTFKPNFKVSTSAKTSRADGASLGVKIVYPTGELGANQASSQSNVKSVKVELPRRLPSRLTTLQKACTAAQFDANPAGCPAASVVGHATAVTPVLPVTLSGPAYFVSNGGEAFPNLIVVLQGYGVTVHLVGDTFISKAGITSSTFKSVPDVPIGSFELSLPRGPFSALAGLGNLCKGRLSMPTDFVAQNGAVLDQNTTIAVSGCHKAPRSAHHGKRRGKRTGHTGAGKTRRPVRGRGRR